MRRRLFEEIPAHNDYTRGIDIQQVNIWGRCHIRRISLVAVHFSALCWKEILSEIDIKIF